jgi:hypothetical protein
MLYGAGQFEIAVREDISKDGAFNEHMQGMSQLLQTI